MYTVHTSPSEQVSCLLLYGLVKVSTGVLQVEKRSGAERQTAKLKINANDRVALAA